MQQPATTCSLFAVLEDHPNTPNPLRGLKKLGSRRKFLQTRRLCCGARTLVTGLASNGEQRGRKVSLGGSRLP